MEILTPLAPFFILGSQMVLSAMAVFTRVAAAVALLPGFGERALPSRVKLAAAMAFTMVVFPMVQVPTDLEQMEMARFGLVLLSEAVAGVILGLSVRLLIMALQTAGTIASQSVAVSQMFGASLTAEPQPAYGNMLTVAGIALSFSLGLPAYAASAMIGSYDAIPFGALPLGSELTGWGVERVAGAFTSAVGLAAPFIVGAFAYNVAIGAINRAMPQLMVAFVGAPAITAGAIIMMLLATPLMLHVWGNAFIAVMSAPYG